MFAYSLLALGLAATTFAFPYPTNSHCREIKIPVTVSVPRFIINATVNDDWDVVALTLNLTRRDFTNYTDPLPVVGTTAAPVKSTFNVGATLCGTGGPLLVLTHGIIESKLYVFTSIKSSLMRGAPNTNTGISIRILSIRKRTTSLKPLSLLGTLSSTMTVLVLVHLPSKLSYHPRSSHSCS